MEMTHYIEQTLLEVFENYTFRGHLTCGENLTYTQHMAQCATLARAAGHDDEVVLAAFFHDIGYLLDPEDYEEGGEYDLAEYEHRGAGYLRDQGFSERIAELVEGLVDVKRYLAYQDRRHLHKVYPIRRPSLPETKAPMSEAEAERFEERLDFLLCLKMREWDDASRRVDLPTFDIHPFRDLARRHLRLQLGDLNFARK